MKVLESNPPHSKGEVGLDQLSNIPSAWIPATLGEVFQWGSGGTPRRSIPEYFGGSIPWAIIGDLNDGLLNETTNTITKSGLENSSARLVPVGSVLLAMYGSIGKLGIAGTELTTNQAIAFTQTEPVFNKYLFWYLRASRDKLVSRGKGDTQSNISQTVIKGFPFLLAPLPEQHRIVAEIEKQFTRLDASVTALKRVQANLKRYRASVLKAACEGKLVPTEAELAQAEGRDYEPADQLLERTLTERRARWESQGKRQGKYKEPATLDMSNLPELPEGWVNAAVEQVIVRSEYGTSIKCNYEAEGVPVLRIPNVIAGEIDLADIKYATQTVTMDAQHALQVGDVLMCRTNGSVSLVGRTAVIRTELIVFHSFASYLLRFRFAETQVLPWWFHTFVNSQLGRSIIELNAASSAGQHNVNLKLIHGMMIPLPPLAEQRRIVAEVERRLSIIQQSEATVKASLKRAERLRQSILKQAFSGQLVPQDPDDEPASALLERIRSEREAAQAAVKAKPKRKRAGRRKAKTTPDSQLVPPEKTP